MKQFKVTEEFRDKYTKEIYPLGVIFVCEDSERIADLQARGLIGEEIPLPPANDAEVETAEEVETSKDVKKDASSRKTGAKNQSK